MTDRDATFNPKRRLLPAEDARRLQERLAALAAEVRYGDNPEHKRQAGDFGLTPPAAARRGRTLCDAAGIFRRAEALDCVQAGLKLGLVDARWRGEGWPRLVWTVSEGGVPLEAQLDGDGVAHGYPMPEVDPLRVTVLARWGAA